MRCRDRRSAFRAAIRDARGSNSLRRPRRTRRAVGRRRRWRPWHRFRSEPRAAFRIILDRLKMRYRHHVRRITGTGAATIARITLDQHAVGVCRARVTIGSVSLRRRRWRTVRSATRCDEDHEENARHDTHAICDRTADHFAAGKRSRSHATMSRFSCSVSWSLNEGM
jgi:hypothetical protein